MGVQTDPAGVLAATVKWFVRLLVLIVAFDALGLPAVSQVLNQLLLWMPNLVVALVVLVIAGLRYVSSSGDPTTMSKAKNTIIYAAIGLVVSMSAFAIVGFVLGNI